jgi:hypothetical protein
LLVGAAMAAAVKRVEMMVEVYMLVVCGEVEL